MRWSSSSCSTSELRRLGKNDEQGPVDPAFIPRGLPASHWWWHYPEQFK
jgi:hypothetical protein